MQQPQRFKEVLKQTLISIFVGACVSLLTVVFQELVHQLEGLKPEIPGAIIGVAKYLHSWKTSYYA